MSVNAEQLNALTQEIPFKWRKGGGGLEYPYINARDVMDLLDQVVGPANWQRDYKEVGGRVYCGVAIKIGDEWVWKWDCGAESNIESQKGESSDAFKRAAVSWGVGRFLYQIKSKSDYQRFGYKPASRPAVRQTQQPVSEATPQTEPDKPVSPAPRRKPAVAAVTSKDWAEIRKLRETIAMDPAELEQTIKKRYGKVWKDLKPGDIKDLKKYLKSTAKAIPA